MGLTFFLYNSSLLAGILFDLSIPEPKKLGCIPKLSGMRFIKIRIMESQREVVSQNSYIPTSIHSSYVYTIAS